MCTAVQSHVHYPAFVKLDQIYCVKSRSREQWIRGRKCFSTMLIFKKKRKKKEKHRGVPVPVPGDMSAFQCVLGEGSSKRGESEPGNKVSSGSEMLGSVCLKVARVFHVLHPADPLRPAHPQVPPVRPKEGHARAAGATTRFSNLGDAGTPVQMSLCTM